jgi:hypothetical protein
MGVSTSERYPSSRNMPDFTFRSGKLSLNPPNLMKDASFALENSNLVCRSNVFVMFGTSGSNTDPLKCSINVLNGMQQQRYVEDSLLKYSSARCVTNTDPFKEPVSIC